MLRDSSALIFEKLTFNVVPIPENSNGHSLAIKERIYIRWVLGHEKVYAIGLIWFYIFNYITLVGIPFKD